MSRNEQLKQARREKGMTQKSLAFEVGVERQTVQTWEKGTRTPSLESLTRLCAILGKTPEELGFHSKEASLLQEPPHSYLQEPPTLAVDSHEGIQPVQDPEAYDVAMHARLDTNRSRMLKRVRSLWIDGVLTQSLHHAAFMALGLEDRPDALLNPWRLEVQETNLPSRPLPAGTSIEEVYDHADGELLILGEPGSGKTTLLLELTRILLERAERNSHHLIPVIFPVASWAIKQQSLTEWLVAELQTKYRVPRSVGQEWIANRRLLVLLDGLDEVAETARAACVKAINVYKQMYDDLPLVVCCRKAEYFAQTTRVALQQAVSILPLTRQQIDHYLARAGSQLMTVRKALEEDSELQTMVQSPLLLSVIMLAYQGEVRMALAKAGSLEERRQQIFDVYVKRMLSRRNVRTHYKGEHVRSWLTWLAWHMHQQNQIDFYLERMQPTTLLPAHLRQRFQRTLVRWVYCLESVMLAATLAWLRGGKTTPTIGGIGGGLFGKLGAGEGNVVLEWMWPGLGLGGLGGGGLVSLVFAIVAVLVGMMIDTNTSFSPSSLRGRERVRKGVEVGLRNGLLCAGLVGCFCLLFFGIREGLRAGITYSSSFGILTGLIIGPLSGLTVSLREEKPARQKMSFSEGMWPGICALIGFWCVDGMLHLRDGFGYGLVVAFFFYAAYTFGKATDRLQIRAEIQPAEVVVWSWAMVRKQFPRNAARGLFTALSTCLSVSVCFGLVSGIARGPDYGVVFGFVFGLIIGVSVGVAGMLSGILNSGLESNILSKEALARPNEGIARSARNAVVAAVIFGPVGGMISGIACGVSFGLIGHLSGWPILAGGFAIAFGLLFSFYFLLIRGGMAVLAHLCLRYYLWREGAIPWKYVRFLDYAAERILLRKIGGGYMFVHRLVLEHFATSVQRFQEKKELYYVKQSNKSTA